MQQKSLDGKNALKIAEDNEAEETINYINGHSHGSVVDVSGKYFEWFSSNLMCIFLYFSRFWKLIWKD